jgi:hypothetical protein
VLVRSRSRGGLSSRMSWEHEEYDAMGQLVARFESFEASGPHGEPGRGWRRFNPHGQEIAEERTSFAGGENDLTSRLNDPPTSLARPAP